MKWMLAGEISKAEAKVIKRLERTGRFFAFLREVRAELFDDAFQAELEQAGYGTPRGQKPLAPAMLAMVTLLQAYTQTSDAEAVVCAELDLRWKLVLGTLGEDDAPFGQGSLPRFRERMIAHELDRRLVDRTVELAKQHGGFGWQMLKAALDSSPLLGAGRVEDTWNLIGRAMRHFGGRRRGSHVHACGNHRRGERADGAGRAEREGGAGSRLGRPAGTAQWLGKTGE